MSIDPGTDIERGVLLAIEEININNRISPMICVIY
ncbi:MAG: hypothetical protein HeimC3_13830 [Candidatus Heimdallarchaeota archaeon LC_3]|nr:MAG: hypothetical protein HeimC3_13830 [Candidatus Heimdallarchaeota archaeon LC_3]